MPYFFFSLFQVSLLLTDNTQQLSTQEKAQDHGHEKERGLGPCVFSSQDQPSDGKPWQISRFSAEGIAFTLIADNLALTIIKEGHVVSQELKSEKKKLI